MELYQLEELAALGKYGTISRAADECGVSQPAMSRSMRKLEEDFAVPIFRRTSNTIELNDTGRLAVEWAGRIVSMVASAKEEVRAFDRRRRTILVGSEAPAPLWSLMSMLSSSEVQNTVAGELRSRTVLLDGLRNGSYRFVITTAPLDVDGCLTVRLGEENLMFLLGEGHPLARRRTLSFSDLDGDNILLYENIGMWRNLPQEAMPRSHFIIQSDRESFEQLVLRSDIPSFTTDLIYMPLEGKVAIPIDDPRAHAEYYVSARKDDQKLFGRFVHGFRSSFRSRSSYAI